MENINENDMNVELLVEMNEISMQMSNAMEYYHQKIKEILTKKANKYNLSQSILSDIQNMNFITDHNVSVYKEIHHQIERGLHHTCHHEWVDDYIDGLNYECRRIIYCDKCKLTKQS